MYLRLVLALAVASYSTCALADLSNPQIRRSLVLGQAPGWVAWIWNAGPRGSTAPRMERREAYR